MDGASGDRDSFADVPQPSPNKPKIPLRRSDAGSRRRRSSRLNSALSDPKAREDRIARLSSTNARRRETDDSDGSDQFYDAEEELAVSPHASPSQSFHPNRQRSTARDAAHQRQSSSTDAPVSQPSSLSFQPSDSVGGDVSTGGSYIDSTIDFDDFSIVPLSPPPPVPPKIPLGTGGGRSDSDTSVQQNINRTGTKKLVQARPYSFMGDDWASDFDYYVPDENTMEGTPIASTSARLAGSQEQAPDSVGTSFNPSSYESQNESALPSRPLEPSPPEEDILYDRTCDVCKRHSRNVSFCNVCKFCFCGACWDAQFVHTQNVLGPAGLPHEKTPPDVAEKVKNALAPPADDRVREQLYRADEVTSWFGIERPSDSGPPIFQDYGRFTDLMASTDQVRLREFTTDGCQIGRDTRTPSLVSFVGQTGAGKSTLIKLIVDFAVDRAVQYQTPVIGAVGAHNPTSEDVHLYLDPRTADGQAPVLFADCEGLEGGEREPIAALFKRKRRSEKAEDGRIASKISRAVKIISERELLWADGPRARTREFAVTNLYPRLLYTFSDVIVFVLKNPRVVEHVFERLVEWAAAAIETSSNQPVLPHALIVLNASETDIDASLWEVNVNTVSILEALARTVNQNETFKRLAQFWRERGRAINNLEELVLSYYSSVQILRVPADGRPALMLAQIEKLYDGILTACIASRSSKANLRMLLDVDDLQSYLQYAFNHYSGTLSSPFDFVQASFTNSPIPPDFGGNILKLAINMMDHLGDRVRAKTIFVELSYIVASCIMFDSARHNIRGTAEQIFPKYLDHLDAALENFCDQHWPCEFRKGNKRCVNVKSGHGSKGHQTKDGLVIADGKYESSIKFSEAHREFRENVFYHLWELLTELQLRVSQGDQQEQAAADIHRERVLRNFFRKVACGDTVAEAYSSHTACFCCLFEAPVHALPCGHIICETCARIYGRSQAGSPTEIEMSWCPIDGTRFGPGSTWKLYTKPKAAGVRILTLDGGGIRGIVELEILRQIEQSLGVQIPVQAFFDLVVGTSTGGVIALGLGAMNWTVPECIEHFERLSRSGFTRRTGIGLPFIGFLVENYHHSKYETKSLECAMTQAFTDDQYLFGGLRKSGFAESPLKVAVIATSLSARTPVVFANYNRACSDKLPYNFQRAERTSLELKVWEAARSTSAAPRYFRSFHHEPTQKGYVDGGIYHNNPINVAEQERKLLWPELEDSYPDIVLSLGTAYNAQLHRAESEKISSASKRGVISHGVVLINLLKNHMATSLECEKIWDSFLLHLPKAVQFSRFVRINPQLAGEVPEMDDVKELQSLQMKVRNFLRYDEQVRKVSLQLLATTFYFQPTLAPELEGHSENFSVEGRIMCRFQAQSKYLMELGKFFKRSIENGVQPYFLFTEDGRPATLDKSQKLSYDMIDRMAMHGSFTMPRTTIHISSKVSQSEILLYFNNRDAYPISGFPRSLVTEVKPRAPRQATASNAFRWAGGSLRSKSMRLRWKTPDPKNIQQPFSIASYADSELELNEFTEKVVVPSFAPLTTSTSPPAAQQPEDGARRGFRNAFRALVQPVRTRLPRTPRDARTYAAGEYALAGSGTALDQAESDIYERWISGLRLTQATMERYDGPAADISGTHELAASVVPIQVNEFLAELPG